MFFKKFLSFFNSKINMIFNINDNKSVRNFLLFFGLILIISIIICIVHTTIGGLFFYASIFSVYDTYLIFHEQSKNYFKNIILKNNYCKLLYYIYIVMWILFILIGIYTILILLKLNNNCESVYFDLNLHLKHLAT